MIHRIVLPCLLALTGCASAPPPTVVIDPAAQALDSSLAKQPSKVEGGVDVPKRAPTYSLLGGNTVSYLGDASKLLGDFAQASGLSYEITGAMPRMPIFVQIDARQEKTEAMLNNIARQLGDRADIILTYPDTLTSKGRLELRYRPQ